MAAAPAAPLVYNFCLTNLSPAGSRLCLVSNGGGNQVTISSNPTNWSFFHKVNTGTAVNGLLRIQLENAAGNCLRAGTPAFPGAQGVVKIENGGCGSTDGADWWDLVNNEGGGNGKFQSDFYGDLLLVHGAVSGNNVWHATMRSGDWFNWTLVQTS